MKSGDNNLRRGELRRLFRARGVPEIELTNKVADFEPLGRWPADALGDKVELTFDEKIKHGIRTIRCFDRPRSAVDDYYAERRRERDRVAARQRRAKRPRKKSDSRRLTEKRSNQVGALLAGRDGWTSAALIANAMRGKAAFRGLDHDGLRQAVHRAVKALGGRVETEKRSGEHGFPTLFVRWRGRAS